MLKKIASDVIGITFDNIEKIMAKKSPAARMSSGVIIR